MKYSVLAAVYEKLENTPAKLEKSDIIAKLLKETNIDLLPKVVLLLNGRVFPSWSESELGVANQLMIRAIEKSCGISQKEINSVFNKTGDLGLTVKELSGKKKQATLGKKTLTVEKVFENMQLLPKQEGKNSQERKLNLIAELLSQASPLESVYVVRTILGQLRIGVAEGIVRDSIAKAFEVESEDVENAWFLNPDYGEIATIAKTKGKKGLNKVKIKIGRPIKVQLAEKAPSLEEALEAFEEPVLEYKYDGARMLIHKKGDSVRIFTRRLENITKAFPDIVELCKENILAKDCILDSEGLAIDENNRPLPFQMISQRIKRKYDIQKTAKQIPMQLNVFDVIYLDGKSFFDTTLKDRRKILSKIVKEVPGKIQLSKQLATKDIKKAGKFYKDSLSNGQEGLIVKNLQATYQPGRRVSGGWLKVKPTLESLDLVITGAVWGTGKRAGWLGSYILACRDPETGDFLECGMLGSGLKEKKTNEDDVTLEELTELIKPNIENEKGNTVKISPQFVIEVAYEEIQKSPTYSSGYALRFPRLLRVRPDKGPDEADDLNRLDKIFYVQKGKRQS
ncbi:MAG: ATP-dependent DNA ligase [Candidatus Aenigmarchaeota archaeon]|nr:ATP-dependent DNA ligase [Candidatus Aenigmarchaeota archaeon]